MKIYQFHQYLQVKEKISNLLQESILTIFWFIDSFRTAFSPELSSNEESEKNLTVEELVGTTLFWLYGFNRVDGMFCVKGTCKHLKLHDLE